MSEIYPSSFNSCTSRSARSKRRESSRRIYSGDTARSPRQRCLARRWESSVLFPVQGELFPERFPEVE